MTIKLCVGIISFWLIGAVGAEPTDSQPPARQGTIVQEFSPVFVQGVGDPATAKYANLLRGVAAFKANRQMGPEAVLTFRVHDRTESSAPLTLRLETDHSVVQIDVNAEGVFTLPSADDVGATEGELVANRHSGDLTIFPRIRSPGFSDEYRRLGDHRLWCEVTSAIDEDDVSPLLRLKILLNGGWCKSSRLRLFQTHPGKAALTGVELSEGGRTIAGIVRAGRNSFNLPVHDLSWSNDATFRLTFGPAQQASQIPDAKKWLDKSEQQDQLKRSFF